MIDGNKDPQEISMYRGGWDDENQADLVTGDVFIYGGPTYTGTAAVFNSAPIVGPYDQPAQDSSVEIVRRFLREAGVPEDLLTGGWDELRGLVCGRLNYGRY